MWTPSTWLLSMECWSVRSLPLCSWLGKLFDVWRQSPASYRRRVMLHAYPHSTCTATAALITISLLTSLLWPTDGNIAKMLVKKSWSGLLRAVHVKCGLVWAIISSDWYVALLETAVQCVSDCIEYLEALTQVLIGLCLMGMWLCHCVELLHIEGLTFMSLTAKDQYPMLRWQ